jgi:23S rRNA G2445 N2-methylase RlmL
MLDQALSWQRMDRLIANGEVILDPACGSGVFVVEAYKRLARISHSPAVCRV